MIHWLVKSFDHQPCLEHGMIPQGMLADLEYDQLANLRTEKRRREWLLGRWTAKQLLLQVLDSPMKKPTGKLQGKPLEQCQLMIDHGPLGAPYALLLPEMEEAPYHLSISHSGRMAFCALVDRQDGWIGADIEHIEKRPEGFEQEYYSQAELRCLAGHAGADQDLYSNLIWSAKEATLKALRLGLRMDTRLLSCLPGPSQPLGEDWQQLDIEFILDELDSSLPVRPLYPTSLLAWWRQYQDYVLTLTISRPGSTLEKPEVPIHYDSQGKTYG